MPEVSHEQLQLLERVARGETLTDAERASLRPDAAESQAKCRYTKEQFARWEGLYGTKSRQLRRYLETGEKKRDACPLDNPVEMPGWWTRNMLHAVPAKILAAAERAKAEARNVAPAVQAPAAVPSTAIPVAEATAPEPTADQRAPLDLSLVRMDEGEELQQSRRLVAAAYERLEKAYQGLGGDVDLLQRRWEKANESLRRAKAQDEKLKRERGDLISVDSVKRDLATASQILAQMHANMLRRVRELCPDLPAEQWATVSRAIESVRSQEFRAFRLLASIKHPEDVLNLIAA